MPSALEALVKVLKLERERGCKNDAVIGGLKAYGEQWAGDAHHQARRPEHHLLVDELASLLHRYEGGSKDERHRQISYMLDRITGRAPMPPEWRARLDAMQPQDVTAAPAVDAPPAGDRRRDRREHDRRERDAGPPRIDVSDAERSPLETPSALSADAPPADDRKRDRRERGARPPRPETPDADRSRGGAEASALLDAPDAPPAGERKRDRRERGARPPRLDLPAAERSRVETDTPGPLDDALSPDTPAYDRKRDRRDGKARPPRTEGGAQTAQAQQQPSKKQKQKAQPQAQPPRGGRPPRGGDDDSGDDHPFDPMGALEFEIIGGKSSAPPRLDLPPRPRLVRPPRAARPHYDPDQASDYLRGLRAPVTTLRGVGDKMASTLEKVGVHTIGDLLFYLPRRYDDYTQILPIRRLTQDRTVTVIGTVKHAEVRIGRNNRRDFFLVLDDGTAQMQVTFFAQFYLQQHIRPGKQLVLRGTTGMFQGRIQMTNPEWEELESEDLVNARIVPVYPLTEGLRARRIRELVELALDYWADKVPDYVPEASLERAELADLAWTLRNLHFPESFDHLAHAKRRFIFDQLLLLQLTVLKNRRAWQSTPSDPLAVDDAQLDAFLSAAFPYPLTGAQRRAIEDIRRDVAKDIPMNRLLQGDVGSGKTAVALTALTFALANGRQAALMSPTGILAEQLYRGAQRTLAHVTLPDGRQPQIALLTGALSSAERDAIYAGLIDGSIDVVVGTHAIIQGGVEFHDLALAVIDEQHRFGVEQRKLLRGKGKNPHLLIMTATPIPRTLSLTLYADLDLSVIDEMPPGRTPVATRVIEPTHREDLGYMRIEDELNEGRQAFIVYPLVEASDRIEAQSAVEAYEALHKVFPNHRLGLLHGRMKPQEKDDIMAAFREHAFDLLVTTSVAEVGVDIPNATVILIESANRFGLAQLHQFRGRVGRGGYPSYCILISDNRAPEAMQRLRLMEATTDGFRLAQMDWELRGPGDLLGTRQSGQHIIKLADDMTPDLVEIAQREAQTIYAEDPDLTAEGHRLLAQQVAALEDDRTDHS